MFSETLLLRNGSASAENPTLSVDLVSKTTNTAVYNSLLYAAAAGGGLLTTSLSEADAEMQEPVGNIRADVRSQDTKAGPGQSYGRKRHNLLITFTQYGKTVAGTCDGNCPDSVSTLSVSIVKDKRTDVTGKQLISAARSVGLESGFLAAFETHL